MSLNITIGSKTSKKSKLFAAVFGIIFMVSGFAAAYLTFGIMTYQYLVTDDWQSVPAKIEALELVVNTGESTTSRVEATYTYVFQGQSYQGDKVSLSTGSDNVGDYWHELHRRLKTDQSNDTATVLVNPSAPSKSLLDRTFRWSKVAFGSLFVLMFGGAGFAVFWSSLKAAKSQQQVIEQAKKGIACNEKNGFWLIFGFGSIFFFIGSFFFAMMLPDIINKGDYTALFILSFVFAGAWIMTFAVNIRRRYKLIGPTPLSLDPLPGAIGGQVGGEFVIDCMNLHKPLDITLTCQRTVKSGKNTSTQVLWQESMQGYSKQVSEGVKTLFLFDCPADLPEGGEGNVSWLLEAQGEVTKKSSPVKFTRNWFIPVFKNASIMQSKIRMPTEFLEQQEQDKAEAATASAASLVHWTQQGQYLHMESTAGRPIVGSLWGFLFGLIFGAVGVVSTSQGWWPGYVFITVGISAIAGSIFTLGRELEIKIDTLTRLLYMRRKWFGIGLYHRQATLFEPSQLSVKNTSSASGSKKQIKYYAVRIEHAGKNVLIAEGIKGEAVAQAVMNNVIEKAFPARF